MPDDTGDTTGATDTSTPDPADQVSALPAWAQKEIADTRREAAKYRTRAGELEPLAARAQQLEDEKKTAEQKANERAEKAEQGLRAAQVSAATFQLHALAAGDFANPDDVSRFLDVGHYLGKDGTFDEKAARSDLVQLRSDRPYLGKQQGPRAPAYQPGQGNADTGRPSVNDQMNAALRQATGRAY